MKKILNRSVCLFLLLLFSYSMLALIRSVLGCTVQPVFYLWAVLLCVSIWGTTCTRKGMWIGLPASALLLFAASRYFPADLNIQLNDVLDRLTGAYWEQVVYPGEAYAYLYAASDHSLLFLFLEFLLTSYMGAAISSRSGRVGLALLGSVPFFITCLAVSVSPPVLPVFGMILFWFLLAVGGSHYDETAESYRRVLGVLLPLSLLLSLLLVYVAPSRYSYDPSTSPVSQALEKLFKSLEDEINDLLNGEQMPQSEPALPDEAFPPEDQGAIPDNPTALWQDSFGDMDLTRVPEPEELEKAFLRVRSDQNGSLYLRTVSYGDYRGSSWARAEENAPSPSLAFTARALAAYGTVSHTLSVQDLQVSAYRCLPYFSREQKDSDSYVPSGIMGRYSVSYNGFPASFAGLSAAPDQTDEELRYRAYAHEYYTRLPESTRAALQALCVQEGLSPDMEDPITKVAAFVQRTGEYDLSVSAQPTGDYAVYFLTESGRGCCVHFATAAAALYRTLGIPARITEGFLIEAKAGDSVEVKGYQTHAWVEIYQDGLGWLPVEVTGQSGLDSDALGAHDPEQGQVPPPMDISSEPVPTDEAQTPSVGLPVGILAEPEGSTAARSVWKLLSPVLLLALLLAVLPLRRLLLLRLRSRSFAQGDTRKAVIAMYNTARKAETYGEETPPLLVQTAERAAFSQHEIRAEEAAACRSLLNEMLNSCYERQIPWNKFRFKFFSALR